MSALWGQPRLITNHGRSLPGLEGLEVLDGGGGTSGMGLGRGLGLEGRAFLDKRTSWMLGSTPPLLMVTFFKS